jgi:hypothetical protein
MRSSRSPRCSDDYLVFPAGRGEEPVSQHTIRKYTVVQAAAKKGTAVAQCQSILNHTTPTMAQHYLGDARNQVA